MEYVVYESLNCVCIPVSEIRRYNLVTDNRTITVVGIKGDGLFLDCITEICLTDGMLYIYFEDNKPFMYVPSEDDAEDLNDWWNGNF